MISLVNDWLVMISLSKDQISMFKSLVINPLMPGGNKKITHT